VGIFSYNIDFIELGRGGMDIGKGEEWLYRGKGEEGGG